MHWRRKRCDAKIVPRVNHINAMLERNTDDVVLSQIRGHWRQASTDLIRLIRLETVHQRRHSTEWHNPESPPSDDEQTSYPHTSIWLLCALPARVLCGTHEWRFPM